MKGSPFALALFLPLLFSTMTAWSQPRVVLEEESHDFGILYPGQVISYDFVMTNVGTEPLTITEVRTTCGCTAAVQSATDVLPGATTIISVTKTANPIPSRMVYDTIIRTNDPQKPEIKVVTTAEVRNLISMSPSRSFDFMRIPMGETRSQTIFIQSEDGNEFSIESVRADHESVTIEVGELTERGYPITTHFRARPEDRGETVVARVNINTTHPVQKVVRSMAYAQVTGFVEFRPEMVYFGQMRVGQTVSRVVNVRLLSGDENADWEITQIEFDEGEGLRGEVVNRLPNGDIQLRLQKTAPNQPGYHRGTARLHTTLENEPVVNLHYTAVIQR